MKDKEILLAVEKLEELSKEAALHYKAIVNNLLNDRITDEQEIEQVMDGMLSFCHSDEMVLLFKQLCRGLYLKYPKVVCDYISYYREMWEEE